MKRTVSDSDRRAYVLTTTKKSQGIKKELRKTMAAWQEMVEKGLTADECRRFDDFLDHAVQNVVMQEAREA